MQWVGNVMPDGDSPIAPFARRGTSDIAGTSRIGRWEFPTHDVMVAFLDLDVVVDLLSEVGFLGRAIRRHERGVRHVAQPPCLAAGLDGPREIAPRATAQVVTVVGS